MEPDDVERVTLLAAARRWEEVMRILTAALASDPDDWEALRLQAGCLLGLEDVAGALKAANRAIAADPDQPLAYLAKARVLVSAANPADARTAVERALQLDPQNESAWAMRALTIGMVMDQHRMLRTHRLEKRAVRESADAYLRLAAGSLTPFEVADVACGLHFAGYGREARALLRQALRDDPQNGRLIQVLAMLDAAKGHSRAAWQGLEASVRSDPQRASAAMESLRSLWYGGTKLALIHLLRLLSFLALMLTAEATVGLSATPRMLVGAVLLAPTVFACLRLLPWVRAARTTAPDLLGLATARYGFVPATGAAAAAVFSPWPWNAVAWAATGAAWFVSWRALHRAHDEPPTLLVLRRDVANWSHFVTRCWLFGMVGGTLMLIDLVTGRHWEPVRFIVAGVLVTRCALLLFGFTYQHPLLRQHWRNFMGVWLGRRAAVLCGLVSAVAWVPVPAGYVLLAPAAIAARQIHVRLSYLVEFGRPEEVFLHDNRIRYRVRTGARRPEAWM
ncbi:tetratricopeptide repeat protein [Streptomyces sp. NPDC093591]|uniref:tetratricopeptide repeat protein n=1 Tax=Streptomyces sp. NPDC093591 TaxID=3366044 RepID=UPI0038276BDB